MTSRKDRQITEVAAGVYRLSLLPHSCLNAYAVTTAESVALVDCGLPWVSAPTMWRRLDTLGVRRSQVTRLIATHAHLDHVGALGQVQRALRARTAAHLDDASYIRSGKTPTFDASTRGGRWANRILRFGFPTAAIDDALRHGQVLEDVGLQVLHTPGHTPGHVCLLHQDSGVLILGDALYRFGGRLSWPNYATCWDYSMTKASARTLADVDFSVACFGHGPELATDARATISEFVSA